MEKMNKKYYLLGSVMGMILMTISVVYLLNIVKLILAISDIGQASGTPVNIPTLDIVFNLMLFAFSIFALVFAVVLFVSLLCNENKSWSLIISCISSCALVFVLKLVYMALSASSTGEIAFGVFYLVVLLGVILLLCVDSFVQAAHRTKQTKMTNMDKLKELKELKENKLLTEEEYKQAVLKLIGEN